MSQPLQPVRGTHDLLPDAYAQQAHVIHAAQRVAGLYGYRRMDTPIFEFSEVFHRTLGDTSDVVTKETYTFADRGGESLTLRPEFTAAIVRAFLSNKLTQELPFKCFYAGPAFRYERPQKGRQRQFHQIGCELLGAAEPEADAEMIALGMQVLHALELSDHLSLEINSLGDAESRARYREALTAFLTGHRDQLSDDSKLRLEKNPLRVLDSKDEGDRAIIKNAPRLEDFFTDAAQHHFDRVRETLTELGIVFTVNDRLVRGLDYYSHTVFEITTPLLGAQNTVLAGGRYDALVGIMSGPEIPGIGWAAGIERLVGLREEAKIAPVETLKPLVAVIPMQETAEPAAWALAQELRQAGIATEMAYKGNGKKRLQRADKLGALVALVIGEDELAQNAVTIKELQTGAQTTVPRDQLMPKLLGMME